MNLLSQLLSRQLRITRHKMQEFSSANHQTCSNARALMCRRRSAKLLMRKMHSSQPQQRRVARYKSKLHQRCKNQLLLSKSLLKRPSSSQLLSLCPKPRKKLRKK